MRSLDKQLFDLNGNIKKNPQDGIKDFMVSFDIKPKNTGKET